MDPKRKKATDLLLARIAEVDKLLKAGNLERYTTLLNSLSDAQFAKYMQMLKNKETVIYVYWPNMTSTVAMEDVIALAKKVGRPLFERVELYDDSTGEWFLTPHKHFCPRLPQRRQQQFGEHKVSLPEGSNKVDLLTGQVVHEDRAAAITNPEIQALGVKNLPNTRREIVSYRGGNVDVWQSQFKKQAEETGEVSMEDISNDSRGRPVVMAHVLWKSMHIDNTFIGDE